MSRIITVTFLLVCAALPTAGFARTREGATGGRWAQFLAGTSGHLAGITTGPHGNAMWAADATDDALLEIPTSGSPVQAWPLVVTVGGVRKAFAPNQLVAGADGRLYADGCTSDRKACNLIVAVTASGGVSSYATPSGDTPDGELVLGPDGDVWFPETMHVGRIAPSGIIREYPFTASSHASTNDAITVGPDGNIWFSHNTGEYYSEPGWLVSIAPDGGAMTAYGYDGCLDVQAIVSARSRLYTLCLSAITAGDEYYSIAPIGTAGGWGTMHPLPTYARDSNMILAPNGVLWFAACRCYGSGSAQEWGIGRFDPAIARFSFLSPPRRFPNVFGALKVGPGTNVWATVSGDASEPSAFVRYGPIAPSGKR